MDLEYLVDLCKKGDEQALAWLYSTYSEQMLKTCLHYVPERTVAQDLLHDGFIVIFSSIHSLRNPERLESWMKKIMRNISLRYLNLQNASPAIPLTDILDEEVPAEEPFPADSLSYDELLGMIEHLPAGYRKVFKLSVLEGLSHQEIGDLLGIAPHSSSSQLVRAKAMLRKMLKEYRLLIVLLLFLLFPSVYDYFYREKKAEKANRMPGAMARRTGSKEKKTKKKHSIQLPPLPSVLLPVIPETRDSISTLPLTNPYPFTVPTPTVSRLPHSFSRMPLPEKKKSGKWKLMLAGSVGSQLAQSLYKLIATPAGGAGSGSLTKQASTWEEYYTYLAGRYEDGTLGNDSIGLLQVAAGNSGKIVEHQHHDAPVTVGISVSKKLNERWSLESGLQYTYLKSDFTTGNEAAILETQKLHYVGLPLRMSYRFWNYKRLSAYATAGMQIDIPVKGTLRSYHTTDSVPHFLGRRSLKAPLQWSLNTSIGIQYHLSPHTSIYLEPTVNYYIPDGSSLRTIRKEHPFTFTVPVGIRFSW